MHVACAFVTTSTVVLIPQLIKAVAACADVDGPTMIRIARALDAQKKAPRSNDTFWMHATCAKSAWA